MSYRDFTLPLDRILFAAIDDSGRGRLGQGAAIDDELRLERFLLKLRRNIFSTVGVFLSMQIGGSGADGGTESRNEDLCMRVGGDAYAE